MDLRADDPAVCDVLPIAGLVPFGGSVTTMPHGSKRGVLGVVAMPVNRNHAFAGPGGWLATIARHPVAASRP